jgi:hypothetical protein
MHGGMESWLHSFLTMTLNVGECTASSTPATRAPGTHYVEGWVGRRIGLCTFKKTNVSCSCQELISNS